MHKTTYLIAALVLITIASFIFMSSPRQLQKIDCERPLEVVYLTHAELSHASEIANKINGVVVIPEDNQLIARTEILKCPGFHYTDYIK